MNYMGAKTKFAKEIGGIINKYIADNNIKNFYDIFTGGANLACTIQCDNVYANDLSPTLIALHRQMQNDSKIIPLHGSRGEWDLCYTEYKRLIKNFPKDFNIWNQETKIPLWKIGAIEWYNSFLKGGFTRGFCKPAGGRDYYNEAYRNHLTQSHSDNFKKINFMCGDYKDIKFESNSLIYADAPYKDTKPYTINPKFNYEEYYNWLRETSKYFPIFISEQSMPDDFQVIWQKNVKRSTNKNSDFKATEKLYFIDNRKIEN